MNVYSIFSNHSTKINGTFLNAAKKAKKFTNPLRARNKKLGYCIPMYLDLYKITNRGQSNHICYTIGNQINRGQEFHPLKASSKVNATRTREEFVAGSSCRLPKIFPSSHSKESISSLVEMYKARTTVAGRLPSKVLHSRVKSWKGKVPPSDLPTSSYNQTATKLLERKAISGPFFLTDKSTRDTAIPLAVTGNLPRASFSSNCQGFRFSQSVRKETNSIDRTRRSVYAGLGLSSSFPLSTSLLRKLEDSDKTVKKAQKLIADYKRSTQVLDDNQRFESKSLIEALEEVKSCRYLRIVERKGQRNTK